MNKLSNDLKTDQGVALQAREDRSNLIRKTAKEYIANGRILATVEGVKIDTIGNDLSFACPACGGALRDDNGLLTRLTEMYLFAPEGRKFAEPSELVIYSTRNPLGAVLGFPGTIRHMACSNCGKISLVVMQLVVIHRRQVKVRAPTLHTIF
jgi:hypothetical protein